MESLGTMIRDARVARGMTQEGLAAALNVSRTTISSWERDRTQPDFALLRQMSNLLDLDLIQGTDLPEARRRRKPPSRRRRRSLRIKMLLKRRRS